MVGGFHGMLLPSAKHSRSLVWWEDTLWKAIRSTISWPAYSVWSDGRIAPYFCQGPVATASIRSKSPARYLPWICVARGANLERRHLGRRQRGIGKDGRNGNLCKKTQCKGSVNAYEWWKVFIAECRWNGKTLWRTSGSENIHLYPGSPRTRRRTR